MSWTELTGNMARWPPVDAHAVETRLADLAMIPVDNSVTGRVAAIHRMLPESGPHIVGEHVLPIRFQLIPPGTQLGEIRTVRRADRPSCGDERVRSRSRWPPAREERDPSTRARL